MAYRQFLKSNGISHDTVEEAEYCHVLESQRIVGQDLDKLTDTSNARDVSIIEIFVDKPSKICLSRMVFNVWSPQTWFQQSFLYWDICSNIS